MIALAETPALPLHAAGPYVAAAYIVFLLVILVYVAIMARKLTQNARELRELQARVQARELAESERELDATVAAPESQEPVA